MALDPIREYTPEVRQSLLEPVLRSIGETGRQDEGRAISSAYSRGMGDQIMRASMVGGARAATGEKQRTAVRDFNQRLAGLEAEGRLEEERRAYEQTETAKDRAFREKLGEMQFNYDMAEQYNRTRAARIQQQQGLVVGGATALGGAALTVGMLSDIRLKKEIRRVGGSPALGVYRFHFRTDEHPELGLPEGEQVGVMAQEVERVLPSAVHTRPDGFKMVDYDRLGGIL